MPNAEQAGAIEKYPPAKFPGWWQTLRGRPQQRKDPDHTSSKMGFGAALPKNSHARAPSIWT